ncbi:GatB/YqeY domain-containing protein [Candidatus Peregrinibacteria bacterium]|nr:MAG: GatB/YqeY domain-containing protein [Candidatus Peregrinibacteria bacterium]
MTLKDQIVSDLTAAMKAREELKLGALRMLKADIMKHEVSGADMLATDDVVITLLKRGIKQRKEAAEAFEKGGNQASADKEREEIKIFEAYLPAQMSEEELLTIAKAVIQEMNATQSDFGKVMGEVMKKSQGQADGVMVSKVVKSLLS